MHVVILAAGVGQRLLPLTKEKPKAILALFHGSSLLSLSFRALANTLTRTDKIVIVAGHGYQLLRKKVETLTKMFNLATTLVYNPKYRAANNCYSLLLGLQNHIDDDVCIINSDVLFDASILDTITQTPHTALCVDNIKQLTQESMKVQVINNRAIDIGKKLNPANSFGEYIGLAKIQKKHVPALQKSLMEVVNNNPEYFYEDAFRRIFADIPFRIVPTNGLLWTEIDNANDVQIAKDIYNRLRNKYVL